MLKKGKHRGKGAKKKIGKLLRLGSALDSNQE
jgi:hypothetical protein